MDTLGLLLLWYGMLASIASQAVIMACRHLPYNSWLGEKMELPAGWVALASAFAVPGGFVLMVAFGEPSNHQTASEKSSLLLMFLYLGWLSCLTAGPLIQFYWTRGGPEIPAAAWGFFIGSVGPPLLLLIVAPLIVAH